VDVRWRYRTLAHHGGTAAGQLTLERPSGKTKAREIIPSMGIRSMCLLLFFPLIGLSQWVRRIELGINWSDSPPPHSLAYFRLDPCRRTGVSDRRILTECDWPSGQPPKRVAKVNEVGSGGWFSVYEVEYFSDDDDSQVAMRSVLVRTAPGQFREIHLASNMPHGTLYPVKLLHAERQPVLKVAFDDGGIYHIRNEEYYVVLPTGPLELNFESVYRAAKAAAPSGKTTYQPASHFDFNRMVFHIQTEASEAHIGAKVACCEGHIEVPFQIEKTTAIAGKGNYFAD
jgi:hypothetical protein